MRYTAAEFALTFGRSDDLSQQVDDKDAAGGRTTLDFHGGDRSYHLVIDASGLDHRTNADRVRERLIGLHRHLRARHGRHTPKTVHARLPYQALFAVEHLDFFVEVGCFALRTEAAAVDRDALDHGKDLAPRYEVERRAGTPGHPRQQPLFAE